MKEDFRGLTKISEVDPIISEVYRRLPMISDVDPKTFGVEQLSLPMTTAIVNLAISHEFSHRKWEIRGKTGRLCPEFLLVNGDPIRQSFIWPQNEESFCLVYVNMWFCG